MSILPTVRESPKHKILIAAISGLVSLNILLKSYKMETAIKPTAGMQQCALKHVIFALFVQNDEKRETR